MTSTIKVLVSVDFDAVSGWLGTGYSPDNTLSDYSSGFFAAQVGVPRLLRMFKRLGIENQVTWFIPGHSAESFPKETKAIVDSGAEIALHGYCHEDPKDLTENQEREIFKKCIGIFKGLTGKTPTGYRAPLYKIRETTIKLLEEFEFTYDSSLSHHDSKLYRLPKGGGAPIGKPQDQTTTRPWMQPLPRSVTHPEFGDVVEIPGNWYMEDMTPMQFWPHTANSFGYVDAGVIENMWRRRRDFLERYGPEDMKGSGKEDEITVFPLILHPDTSGMAHILLMIEEFLAEFKAKPEKYEFTTFGECATLWNKLSTTTN